MSEHFFSRWSQRKQAVAKGVPVADAAAPVQAAQLPDSSGSSELVQHPCATPGQRAPGAVQAKTDGPPAEPLPSLDDARALTTASDFQPFMRPGVAADVRNVAMKKLFTDPHFNVMDGLDIYIGDYNTPDPLPAGMLQKMVGAQLLNLFPEETQPSTPDAVKVLEVNPESSPAMLNGAPVVAQSPPSQSDLALSATDTLEHDDPDLQLQPNHAPASPSPGPSTG
jgi:hypothetical protein